MFDANLWTMLAGPEQFDEYYGGAGRRATDAV